MKTIRQYLWLIAFALLFSGCEKSEEESGAHQAEVISLEDESTVSSDTWPAERTYLVGETVEDADLAVMSGYNQMMWGAFPEKNHIRVVLHNSTQHFIGEFTFPPSDALKEEVHLKFEVDLNTGSVESVAQTNADGASVSLLTVEDEGLIRCAKNYTKVLSIQFDPNK